MQLACKDPLNKQVCEFLKRSFREETIYLFGKLNLVQCEFFG